MSNTMIKNAISTVIALGLAGVTTTALSATASTSESGNEMMNAAPMQGMEKCFGIVKAGMNDCGSASHNCSGEAKMDGDKNDWIYIPTGLCQKIVGGSTKPANKS